MVLETLKEQTRREHEQIESQLNMFERVKDIPSYVEILKRYYGFLFNLEPALAAHADLVTKFEFEKRKKLSLAHDDLKYFKISDQEIENIPRWNPNALVDDLNLSRAVGILYVLEGSTLGGKLISDRFRETLKLQGSEGLHYFSSYGPNLGAMWKSFRASVEAVEVTGALDAAACVTAATETFRQLSNWFS